MRKLATLLTTVLLAFSAFAQTDSTILNACNSFSDYLIKTKESMMGTNLESRSVFVISEYDSIFVFSVKFNRIELDEFETWKSCVLMTYNNEFVLYNNLSATKNAPL